jgi:hypothetical protein
VVVEVIATHSGFSLSLPAVRLQVRFCFFILFLLFLKIFFYSLIPETTWTKMDRMDRMDCKHDDLPDEFNKFFSELKEEERRKQDRDLERKAALQVFNKALLELEPGSTVLEEVADYVFKKNTVNLVKYSSGDQLKKVKENARGAIGLISLDGEKPEESRKLLWLSQDDIDDNCVLLPVLEDFQKTEGLMKKLWPDRVVLIHK